MQRYSVIYDKNPREIVLLRGTGCHWRRCTFCDYYDDASPDKGENYALNRSALLQVTGQYQRLEVINSGSFPELDEATMELLCSVCQEKGIRHLHFESHWMYRRAIPALRERFSALGVTLHLKIGVESFDESYREGVLQKGMPHAEPEEIAAVFDEVNLLVGLPGQTVRSMQQDIDLGLRYFSRICVNVMTENSAPLQPDPAVVASFLREVYPAVKDNERADILLNNTDFGVGET